MTPAIKIFLYFNGFIVLLLIFYMLFIKTRSVPTRLKLKQQHKMRQLNVYFQFNGHDFDAHETLGVVAGCSLDSAEKAFRELLAASSEDTHEFYRKAFEAIRVSLK